MEASPANLFVEYDDESPALRPLAEVPALRLVHSHRDVRGWEIHGQDGRPLGRVVDLLVDVDALQAKALLVSRAGERGDGSRAVVRLQALAPEDRAHRRLTPGAGMEPIALRYQSTTRFTLWAAIVIVIVAFAAWMMGVFG
jgi:hypothetical protein